MGAAGDMLMSALLELVDNREKTVELINSIGFNDTVITFEEKRFSGVSGTHASVIVGGKEEGCSPDFHTHRTLGDVFEIIDSLDISDSVCKGAKKVYEFIAKAEGKVHRCDASVVHFHEVGMMDAIVDVTVVLYLFEMLGIDRVICSPVNAGNGYIQCAHGVLPVPAPATAELLTNLPYYCDDIIQTELCTPTGAALIRYLADDFGAMPVLRVNRIGYGVGTKKLSKPNVLRAFLGDADDCDGYVSELSFNVDDMTAEELANACEIFMNNGACDVFQTPVNMKKNRLGTLVDVVCRKQDKQKFIELIFRHTSTIGIREHNSNRYILERQIKPADTVFGKISVKNSYGYGTSKSKYEYEELKSVSEKNNISLYEVNRILKNTK